MIASYVPLMVKLNEGEKRAVQIILVLAAITFIIVSIIAKLIKNRLTKEGEVIDSYMYPLIQYGIIKDAREFRRYVYRRESRQLYISLRWTMRTVLLITALYLLYMINFQQGDFHQSWVILQDMFFKLNWPTVKVFGITMVSDWPTVVKAPQFYLNVLGYVTYITALSALGLVIKSSVVTLAYLGRLQRSSDVAVKSFTKNLEKGVDIIHEE